jgi:hypothetical protein
MQIDRPVGRSGLTFQGIYDELDDRAVSPVEWMEIGAIIQLGAVRALLSQELPEEQAREQLGLALAGLVVRLQDKLPSKNAPGFLVPSDSYEQLDLSGAMLEICPLWPFC